RSQPTLSACGRCAALPAGCAVVQERGRAAISPDAGLADDHLDLFRELGCGDPLRLRRRTATTAPAWRSGVASTPGAGNNHPHMHQPLRLGPRARDSEDPNMLLVLHRPGGHQAIRSITNTIPCPPCPPRLTA